jgi:hypothetical protein
VPRRDHHQARDADDHVDDIGDRPGPEDLRDEVPVEQPDQPPVEGSDHHEREPQGLEALDELHRFLLRCDGFV